MKKENKHEPLCRLISKITRDKMIYIERIKRTQHVENVLTSLPTGSVATFPSVMKAFAELCSFLFNK